MLPEDTREYTIEQMEKGLAKYPFSDAIKDGIRHYIMEGIPMGHFLTAIFSNNLMEAAGRADDKNIKLLKEYAQFLYNYVPHGCKGSDLKVNDWIISHRKLQKS